MLSVIFACDLSNKNGNNSNNSNGNKNKNQNTSEALPTPNRPADAQVYIERIYMAKDDNGQPGAETVLYEPGDHKVHCLIYLNKARKGTLIRFVWKILDVEGTRNQEITTTEYPTNSFENKIHGHLERQLDWPRGTYRVEVYINGYLDKTIDYTIG